MRTLCALLGLLIVIVGARWFTAVDIASMIIGGIFVLVGSLAVLAAVDERKPTRRVGAEHE